MTPTDRAEANHLALIGLAKWFANVLFRGLLGQANRVSRTHRSESSKPSEPEQMLM